MASLQDQGVPIQSELRGPNVPQETSPVRRTSGPRPTRQTGGNNRPSRASRSRPISDYTPSHVANKSSSGIGVLEAEFFGALVLLILLMFASAADYSSKIMSIMKRGTLICVLFFILAIVAGIGPNMAKISKALGALVVIGILLTTPFEAILLDTDNLIKNDWVSTGETGTDVAGGTTGSANAGTQSGSSSAAQAAGNAIGRTIQGSINSTATGAPQAKGTGLNTSITNELLKIRQLPINEAKTVVNFLKGLF